MTMIGLVYAGHVCVCVRVCMLCFITDKLWNMLALGSAKIIQIRRNEFLYPHFGTAHFAAVIRLRLRHRRLLENEKIALDAIKCKISKKLWIHLHCLRCGFSRRCAAMCRCRNSFCLLFAISTCKCTYIQIFTYHSAATHSVSFDSDFHG